MGKMLSSPSPAPALSPAPKVAWPPSPLSPTHPKPPPSSSSSSSSSSTFSSSSSSSKEHCHSVSSNSAPNTILRIKPHRAHDSAWADLREAISSSSHKKKPSSPHPDHSSLSISDFKVLGRLGYGDIGSVYLAQLVRGKDEKNMQKGRRFAIKAMDKAVVKSREKGQRMAMEVEVLEMVDHPFLPTLYAHLDTERFRFLVMDFCSGGDLHALRHKQPRRVFRPIAARFYASEVLVALEYLHMLGIVYRDLKPENVLVREDGHIMLTDFDLSLKCDVKPQLLKTHNPLFSSSSHPAMCHPQTSSSGNGARLSRSLSLSSSSSLSSQSKCLFRSPSLSRKIGFSSTSDEIGASSSTMGFSPRHHNEKPMSIEVVVEPTQARSMSFVGTHEYLAPEVISGQGHGSAVDWWTFGIFLYELLLGTTPFKGSTHAQTLANILKEEVKFPKANELEHAKDLIRQLLVKDPNKRLGSIKGATEIKLHPFFRDINWALIRCVVPPHVSKSSPKEVTNMHSNNSYSRHPNGSITHKPVSKGHSHFDYF